MALTLIPSDLVENWTDSDRRHCSRMLHQAFGESFQVKQIQRAPDGLSAYDAPFDSFESVRFQQRCREAGLTGARRSVEETATGEAGVTGQNLWGA